MSPTIHKLVAGTLAVVAGVVILVCGGWLIADAGMARWRAPREKTLLDGLLVAVRTDAGRAPVLQAEWDRQTQTSLARDQRAVWLAKTLIAGAAAFLIGAKRFVALRSLQPAIPREVIELHVSAKPASAAELSRRAGAAGPSAGPTPAATFDQLGVSPFLPVPEQIDLSAVEEIVAHEGRSPAATIAILHAIQGRYRYLPDAALHRVCELTEITPAQLSGVATFYPQFRRTPVGRHLLRICHGTACHVAGAARISDELRRHLHIADGADTDPQRDFTLQEVPCLGCCTLAPVVQIDGVTHGHTRPDGVVPVVREAVAVVRGEHGSKRRPVAALRAGPGSGRLLPAGEIRIGLGSCCVANGSERVYEAMQEALAASGVTALVKRVGCVGMCHQTPFVEVRPLGRRPAFYSRVQPELVQNIVRRHFKPTGLARRLRNTAASTLECLRDGKSSRAVAAHTLEPRDPPVAAFLGRQVHIATEHCGSLDPLDLDEYLAHDGFKALADCLTRFTPDQVVEQIRLSGLRGRGGAGFPTAAKWATVSGAAGDLKYVICNGDEGDPGAFMDRMIMESYPYRVIEGLAIAAYAVGATEGYFYIRAEYPLAVERITQALRRCEERGLLRRQSHDETGALASAGPRGLKSAAPDAAQPGWSSPLHLRVVHGAGAFVCGEETALIASLEGQRGVPTLRPPYPAECGLWDRPTLVNNVESYAVVPWILRNGPAAFAAVGTPTSKGTKVFALTGKIQRGGLIEVPMGLTIREIVEDIGGGVKIEQTATATRPHTFKAVQIGGPSGGCVPASLADTPVDYEALAAVGAMMGSGGLVVLDETDCMVDIARYFLSFTQNQSCGKCVPCRVGTKRMLEILDRLCEGRGRAGDLDLLENLCGAVGQTSLCGLGKTAPNPVLSTLRYFREEYEAHLHGRCPAGKCKALIRYAVTEACTGCTLCAQHCPAGAIALRPYEQHEIDDALCTRCDGCRIRCPEDAICIVS